MVSLQDIAGNTRLAREMALTAQYDTAAIYYQGVVQQIHRLLQTIQEPSRKQQWQQVTKLQQLWLDIIKHNLSSIVYVY